MRMPMQWTISGRSARRIARMLSMDRTISDGAKLPRSLSSGTTRQPSAMRRSAWLRTRVATTTAQPASSAARAIGRKCWQNDQSSVTK
jgi:hypothetical protein